MKKQKETYWVFDPCPFTKEMHGPFESIAAAESWLRKQALDDFLQIEQVLAEHNECEFAQPVHILKLAKTVKQLPSFKASVKLKTIRN